jgi:hypothetical protein
MSFSAPRANEPWVVVDIPELPPTCPQLRQSVFSVVIQNPLCCFHLLVIAPDTLSAPCDRVSTVW